MSELHGDRTPATCVKILTVSLKHHSVKLYSECGDCPADYSISEGQFWVCLLRVYPIS